MQWNGIYMVHNLETAILRSLTIVAKTGNVSEAAKILNRSQSAISQQIIKLEKNTGHALFLRKGQKMVLTHEGEVLFKYAEEIVALTDKARYFMSNQKSAVEFKVGAPDDYARFFLAEPLKKLGMEYPEISINVSCSNSKELAQKWNDGELDFCVVATSTATEIGHTLREEELCWVSSQTFSLKKDSILPLAGFPAGCYVRDAMESSLDFACRPWRNVFSSNNILTIQDCIASGTAISAIERSLIPAYLKKVDQSFELPRLQNIRIALLNRHKKNNAIQSRLTELVKDYLLNKDTELKCVS